MKRIAEEGVVLSRFIANSCWTPPAHASMFTGLLPSQHGVFFLQDSPLGYTTLSEKLDTLAEILKKNHMNTAGFVANPYLTEEHGFHQGFEEYNYETPVFMPFILNMVDKFFSNLPESINSIKNFGRLNANYIALSDQVLGNAWKWIKENGLKQNFFLFINLMDQHYIRYFKDPINGNAVIGPKYYLTDKETMYLHPETMTDKNIELLAWHKQTIKYTDYYLGEFFDKLKSLNLYNSSTIIITSDHGEMFGEWGYFHHQDCIYYPLVFVPFIIKYSESMEGRKINHRRLFQQTDIFSEILDLFQIPIPSHIYGRPFTDENGYPVISQIYRKKNIPPALNHIVNRDLNGTFLHINGEDYQLIYSTSGQPEMYRVINFLNTDIINLYDKFKTHSQVVKFIENSPVLMERKVYKNKSFNNQEIIEKLKSLGYLK